MSEAAPASGISVLENATGATTPTGVAPVAAPVVKKTASELRTLEHNKTPEQRAEDVAYTINHAVSCATTDIFIVPTISALPTMFGKDKKKFDWGIYTEELSGYLRGEIIGDFLAVPLTIGVQRFLPGLMDTVGRLVDPLAKPIFHHGARTAAERWGKKRGLAATNEEVVIKAEEIYLHEMQHLPQAIVWNLFSFPLGVIGQIMTPGHGHVMQWKEWSTIARNKILGTAISNVLLIGGRALLPDKAEKFDRLDSKYIIRPTTRAFSGLLGIDRKTMDTMDSKAAADEQREKASWRDRVMKQDHSRDNDGIVGAISSL